MRALPMACALLGALSLSGCSDDAEQRALPANRQAIVYDGDDRHEPYQEVDLALREYALRSTLAIMPLERIVSAGDGTVSVQAETLAQSHGVCGDEPFASQPSAAMCTGVLIEEDLVLTAGHCVALVPCERLALVFGFNIEAGDVLRELSDDDVFRCAEVVSARVSDPSSARVLDYAWLKLDRAVSAERWPIGIDASAGPLALGERVAVVGHGAGLPVKVATQGRVVDPRASSADFFKATLDNFEGGSGAGVFTADGTLAGIAARGGLDFVPSERGCNVVRRVAEGESSEEVTYVRAALDGLCKAAPDAAPELCVSRSRSNGGCNVSAVGAR